MSGGAIVAILVGLLLLDIAVIHFEILWHRPSKRAQVERLESKVRPVLTLVLVAAALAVIPFALSQGRFLAAAACAFSVYVVVSNHRRTKQGREREL